MSSIFLLAIRSNQYRSSSQAPHPRIHLVRPALLAIALCQISTPRVINFVPALHTQLVPTCKLYDARCSHRAKTASTKAERVTACAARCRLLESDPDDELKMAFCEEEAAATTGLANRLG